MPKTAKAPHGFYSASDAMKKLGMPKSSFYDLVEKGTIKKVVQPGRKDAYYLKVAIDSLVKARELFTIQYASDAPTFSKATEDDIRGIYDLAVSLWGTRGTYPYELRLERFKRNPNIFYVLKYLDIVVGYITFMPVSRRAVDEIRQTGKRASSVITLDDILPFTPGSTIEYVFLEIAVRDDSPKPKQYAMHLMSGMSRILDEMGREGIVIKKLFGTSRTEDGIDLSRRLGFKESEIPSTEGTLAFELDIAMSDHPLLREYNRITKE